MLRFIHIADIHADKDPIKQAKLQESFDEILLYCKNNTVEAVLIAGDVWESRQSYDSRSGVSMVYDFLRQLSKLVNYIFIVKGNNAHDEPGSIKLLHNLEPNIIAYEELAIIGISGNSYRKLPSPLTESIPAFDYIVTLLPYPTKAALAKDQSIDNNNQKFNEAFAGIFEYIGELVSQYDCPHLMAAHLNVSGSRLSSGQSLLGQDIMFAPSTLLLAKQDYYALGHIHLRQFFDDTTFDPMGYSGGLYNKNWGETDQKSFEVVEIDEDNHVEHFPVEFQNARPMVKIEAEFKDGEFVISADQNDNLHIARQFSSEVRFRFKINENDLPLLTDAKLEDVKTLFGADAKIERQIIPAQRESRSEKIIECRTLSDEVEEYASVIQEEIPEGVDDKLFKIEVF